MKTIDIDRQGDDLATPMYLHFTRISGKGRRNAQHEGNGSLDLPAVGSESMRLFSMVLNIELAARTSFWKLHFR